MMKRLFTFVFLLALSLSTVQAQNVALIDDCNLSDNIANVETALSTAGISFTKFDLADMASQEPALELTYNDIKDFDFVIWYVSNDRVGVYLWDETNPTEIKFHSALQQYYENNDGTIWIDGIDVLLTLVNDPTGASEDYLETTTPHSFSAGDFAYDVLGISSWDFESKTDEGDGVAQLDKEMENSLTSLNTIMWRWSTLWRGDGWTVVSNASSLYKMGDSNYPGAAYSSFHQYNKTGVAPIFFSSVRIGDIGDGSEVVQNDINTLVAEVVGSVSGTTGVEVNENTFSVYPNPVNNLVTVDLAENSVKEIRINDICGRLILSREVLLNENKVQINVSEFVSGIYNLLIISENHISTQKLLVR